MLFAGCNHGIKEDDNPTMLKVNDDTKLLRCFEVLHAETLISYL